MDSPNWLDDEEQRAWRAYLDATRLLFQRLDRQLTRDAGLSFTDFELLTILSEAPGHRLRMSELAEAVTTTRSGVTRAITRLVEAGWVRRETCAEDKRGMHAELTAAGMNKLEESSPGHVAAVRAHMIDLLGPHEMATFSRSFGAMRAQMSENG